MTIKLGAHLSISKGYDKPLQKIKKIGGSCLQLFSTSPRRWKLPTIEQNKINQFIKLKKQLNINPVYFHASYLINLSNKERIGQLSKQFLISELTLASKLKIKGSIIHLGSFKKENKASQTWKSTQGIPLRKPATPVQSSFGNKHPKPSQSNQNWYWDKYSTLIKNIKEILSKTPKDTLFIIENAGTRKIGYNLNEISQIINDLNNKRVKLCLDTCHLFSAGYKFSNKNQLNKFLNHLEKLSLLDKLVVWHLNDSRDPFSSFRDRHENIGQGYIGLKTFKLLINHQKLKSLPFIIETPGFDKKGPDKKNLDVLKKLAT